MTSDRKIRQAFWPLASSAGSHAWLWVAIAALFPAVDATVDGADWSHWRGPEQTGVVREKAVVTEWSPDGQNLLWKSDVGGRTTPLIMDGRVYLIGPVGQGLGLRERIVALDFNTGKTLWEYSSNVFLTDIVENRVGWTALAGDPETGNLYAHCTGGEFVCLSRDGKLIWKMSLTEEYGRVSGFGGRLVTPLVDEDRVIVAFLNSSWGEHAKPAHRFLAVNKRTGEILWWSSPGALPLDTIYSNPVVAVIGGVRMLIAGGSDGAVHAMKARTGEPLWSFRTSKLALNASVVVDGDRVFASHSEENISGTVMGRVVCIDGTKRGDVTETAELWRQDGLEAGYASLAVANGRLYAIDNSANLHCLHAATGRLEWKHNLGRVGKGSPVVTSDGVMYVAELNGVFHILRDAGSQCEVLDQDAFTRPDEAIVEIYGCPAVVDGRVVFVTRYNTFCLGKQGVRADTLPIPAVAEVAGSKDAATFQVHPAEVALAAGGTAKFRVAAFNAQGQVVDAGPVEWSLAGVKGVIHPDGTFMAPADPVFTAGSVVGKIGPTEVKSRIRIGPRFPLREDFESYAEGSSPSGWVGVARKTKIVSKDGSKVLQKLAEDASAPFMRVRGYMGVPQEGGYTIVADVLGTPKGERFRPDMGLINSRYDLTLLGGSNELRIESWTPIPRLRVDVAFPWETDKWYRMKFQVKLETTKAMLRGKVWPRDSEEPKNWTLEFEDPYPNREGSPGLYGYSPGTTPKSKGPEVFFDNVQVSNNE